MTEDREKLIEAIRCLSEYRPELRLGQMLIALTYLVRPAINDSIYDIEDAELIDAANQMMTPQTNVEKTAA